jgi:hypothetical protein
VAYYPTEIPFHHRSAWLGDRDVLGELITGCRKMGMSVLVRTDPHATYDDAKAAHPDWIAVDAKGKPRRHWASPEMWVTCAYGAVQLRVHDSGASRNHVALPRRWDLSESLGWESGDCYCGTAWRTSRRRRESICRARHRCRIRLGGRGLEWRQERLMSLLDVWNQTIRADQS